MRKQKAHNSEKRQVHPLALVRHKIFNNGGRDYKKLIIMVIRYMCINIAVIYVSSRLLFPILNSKMTMVNFSTRHKQLNYVHSWTGTPEKVKPFRQEHILMWFCFQVSNKFITIKSIKSINTTLKCIRTVKNVFMQSFHQQVRIHAHTHSY